MPCAGRTDLFFSTSRSEQDEAKSLCRSCTVQVPCASGALVRREPAGVWGGMTVDELQAAVRGVDQEGTA